MNKERFAARLIIARRLAQELSEPAERILALTNRYTRALYDVDAGVRAIINNAPRELRCRSFSGVGMENLRRDNSHASADY